MGKISTYTLTDSTLTDSVLGDTAAPTTVRFALDRMLALAARSTVGGRLSVQTNVAVPVTDQAAQSTLYYTPYLHKDLGLYDGTRWHIVSPAQISLALSGLTTGKNYDAFVDWNGGTPALVLGPAWTNDTTRATALVPQDGINVLTGTLTSRWVGTIRASSATTTEDTFLQRYVWNAYNRQPRALSQADGTGHTYSSSTVRQWNATAANKVEFVLGLAGQSFLASVAGDMSPDTTSGFTQTGIALDSLTVMGSGTTGASTYTKIQGASVTRGLTGNTGFIFPTTAGYHFLAMLEAELANASSTFNQAFVTATILG